MKKEPAEQLLGDYVISKTSFPHLEKALQEFKKNDFLKLSEYERINGVNQALLSLIQNASPRSFLLPAVIEFVEHVNQLGILNEPYHITNFEFWLNHFSNLNEDENYRIRALITGKLIPRDDYQQSFPIGMNKTYKGTHFVSAHLSPDVDTMVASFWGWMDAFAARVGSARHVWGLPGGPPDSPVTRAFQDFFGSSTFKNVAYMGGTLTLSALDLMTQKGLIKKQADTSLSSFEIGQDKAVILVDKTGKFLGDWQTHDIEPIRKIIIRFKSCLRWFENNLHVRLISLFAKKNLHVTDIKPFLSSVFDVEIAECEPAKEFTERQKRDLNDFFVKVFELKKGLNSTYSELIETLHHISINDLGNIKNELYSLENSELFDSKGILKEDRPLIFHFIEKIIHQLDLSIKVIRDYVEQLDIALKIKNRVFNIPSEYITLRTDVEDIRIKMKNKNYLTVVVSDGLNHIYPIGIVWDQSIQQQTLGTISFRDFCNQEEVRMASYLTPISVVDHHKTSLKTSSPPLAIIGDAQSCNVIMAEQAFNIYSRYSLNGMTPAQIDEALKDSSNIRLLQRSIQRKSALSHQQDCFIHPDRELVEYICYLHAILDDTDLLTKVSKRDVECVIELLNRIKSLTVKKDVEIINLDNIPKDKDFAKAAAKRILRNQEMYSFYRKVFLSKEKEIEESLSACKEEHFESIFLDTKEQNGCCRVGQTKLFSSNFPAFQKSSSKIMAFFVKQAEKITKAQPEIDLHMHMISTISSAEEVYHDHIGHFHHQDELWFYAPSTQKGLDHLSSFLTGFQASQKLGANTSIKFSSTLSNEVKQLFIQNFPNIPYSEDATLQLPIVIICFTAGLLNSRKAMITPYLPKAMS